MWSFFSTWGFMSLLSSYQPSACVTSLLLSSPHSFVLSSWNFLFVALFILCSRCCSFSSKFPPLYFFVMHSGEYFIHDEFIISVFMFSYLRNLLFICCCCSVAKLCLTLCGPVDCSTPGSPVLHHLPEFTQTHVHCVGDAIQPSHPLSPRFPPALPDISNGKESACSAGDLGLIPGSERSPGAGNGNPLQYFCLENPMDRGALQATGRGITKSQTWLSDILSVIFL